MIRFSLKDANRIVVVMLALLSTILISVTAHAETLAGIAVFNPPGTSDHIPVMPGELALGKFDIVESVAELIFDPTTGTSSGGTILLQYEAQFNEGGTLCLRSKLFSYSLSSGQSDNNNVLRGTYTLVWKDSLIGRVFGSSGECPATREGGWTESWSARTRTDMDSVGLKGNLIEILDEANDPLAELLVLAPECPNCGTNLPPDIQEWLVSNETPAVGERVSFAIQVFDPNPGDTLSFAWFANDQAIDSTSASASYTPSQPGIVEVRVEVSDPHGATSVLTFTLNVQGGCSPSSASITQVHPQQAGCSTVPKITNIEWPAQLFISENSRIRIWFEDADKDIKEVLISEPASFGGRKVFAQNLPDAANKSFGFVDIFLACVAEGTIEFAVFLIDAKSQQSNGWPVKFECVAEPPAPPKPATPVKPVLSDAQKKLLERVVAASEENKGEIGFTLSVFCTAIGIAAGFFGTPVGGAALGSVCGIGFAGMWFAVDEKVTQAKKWLADPPDSNFMVIGEPQMPRIPTISESDHPGVSREMVDAWNELLTNMLQQSALMEATVIAAERAQGAALAGDSFWQAKQTEIAALYSSQLAVLMNQEASQRVRAQQALQSTDLAKTQFTKEQVELIQEEIRNNGLHPELIDLLMQAGLSQNDLQEIQNEAIQQRARALSGNLKIADEDMLETLHEAAKGIQEFSNTLDPSLPVNPLPAPPSPPVTPSPPTNTAPQITSIGIPNSLTVGTPTEWTLGFADADGDIIFIRFEQWVNGQWVPAGEGDPDIREKTSGSLTITTTCDQLQTVRVKVTIVDAVDNVDIREYSYDCVGAEGTPSPSPGGQSISKALDINLNGVLDDPEIRKAIQMWILGDTVPGTDQTIDDGTIRQLIQMWILGTPVSQSASAAAAAMSQPFNVRSLSLASPSPMRRVLNVAGRNVDSIRIQVFDLSGRLQVEAQSAGPRLRFSLLNQASQPLANGVYLYVVTVRGTAGETWRSEVRKMVMLK